MGQIADTPEYASRFSDLIRSHGTLCPSFINALEIGNQGPGASVRRIRSLLVRLGGAFVPLDAVPPSPLLHGSIHPDWDWIDRRLAEAIAGYAGARVGELSAASFLDWSLMDSSREFVANAKSQLASVLNQPPGRDGIAGQRLLPDPAEPRASQVLHHLVGAAITADRPFEPNDTLDLFHAAVPLASCDFVMLDGRWAARGRSVPAPPRRAQVFSGKKGQIDAFLDALEAWTPAPEVK